MYATMLPQAYAVLTFTYRSAGTGFSLFSGAFLGDLLSGLREGFGAGLLLVVPFLRFMGYGFLVLVRRQWLVAFGLALPLALSGALLLARGLSASPRFFLLGLPLADLAVVMGVDAMIRGRVAATDLATMGRRERLVVLAIGILTVASLGALPRYYATPKQSYRAALGFLAAHRAPGDLIVLIESAEDGTRFYAERAGLREGQDFVAVRTVSELENIVRARGAGHSVLVTTFLRALVLGNPDLFHRIEKEWEPIRRFPAAVHDGTIAIWQARPR